MQVPAFGRPQWDTITCLSCCHSPHKGVLLLALLLRYQVLSPQFSSFQSFSPSAAIPKQGELRCRCVLTSNLHKRNMQLCNVLCRL